MQVYCPKCQAANDDQADPILCQQCGHEFSIIQDSPAIATVEDRREILQAFGVPQRSPSKAGPVLALIIIVATSGAYLTGYIPLGLALTIALIGILCAIVVQLASR